MSFNFTVKEFILGGGTGTPTLQFYKRGFNLAGNGTPPSWQDIILSGNTALTLVNALANGLNYIKLFGGCEQRNLPSEYTQVEYIESSGTQYIDTGITDVTDSEFILDAKLSVVTSGSFPTMLGATDATNSLYKVPFGETNSSMFYTQVGAGSNNYTYASAADANRHTFKLTTGATSGGILYIDNATFSFSYDIQPETTLSLYLFARNNNGSASNFISMACYGLSVKKSGVLVRDLIPCRRNSDNVLGMYDTVTGNFLTNAGTGTFTAGADVTPSPDTPMDIVCNNGMVKAFKTLNISTYDTSASNAGIDITFDGTTDRQKWDTLNDGGTGTRHYENGFVSIYMGQNGNTYYVKALVNGVVYGGSVYNTGEQIYNWNYNIDKNIDIYCPAINTDGTTETVEVTGKNLYNPATKTAGYYISATGEPTEDSESYYSALITVQPNTTYVYSGNSTRGNKRLHAYDTDGNWIEQINYTASGTPFAASGTTPANCKYVRISGALFDTNVQLEQGSTATTYEPYFNGGSATAEMLLKVGDYKDVQEVLTGNVTRNIGIKVLDGTETWNVATNEHNGVNRNNFYTMFDDATATGTDFIICSIAPWAQTAVKDYSAPACRISGSKNFNIVPFEDTTTIPNVVSWTQYLAQQYANGTPVIVIYPLAEPTTETVTGQPLTTQAGTNIVEITQSAIDNLGLEVSYKATT